MIHVNVEWPRISNNAATTKPRKAENPMSHYHAVVWLDHSEARILSFNEDAADKLHIPSHLPNHHVHHKAGSIGAGKQPEDSAFFQGIAHALQDAVEVLIVGPGKAKLELVRHLHRHAAGIEKKVVAVETIDHPSDGQLLAYARKYFHAADRMRSQV